MTSFPRGSIKMNASECAQHYGSSRITWWRRLAGKDPNFELKSIVTSCTARGITYTTCNIWVEEALAQFNGGHK